MSEANKMLAYEPQKKNGWLAALLNFLVPGVGYGDGFLAAGRYNRLLAQSLSR